MFQFSVINENGIFFKFKNKLAVALRNQLTPRTISKINGDNVNIQSFIKFLNFF